jgi:hypothetical protein
MDATGESTKIELPEFRHALEDAVTRRGATYQERCIVIFYYEDDDTGAEADVTTLSNCFTDVFGFDEVVIVKLERKDRSPAVTLNEKIRQVHARIGNPANILPSLLILAYVGHGLIDRATRKLKMMSAGGQSIQWQYLET